MFCAPELAFPVLSSLSSAWNSSQYVKKFGRVSLYPVSRMSPPVHDSILNFWEMWHSGKPSLGINLIDTSKASFYFEINEDFNLNLKLDSDELNDAIRNDVWKRLSGVNWPSFVNGYPREYKQGTFVLYEFDFGFLKEVNDIPKVMNNLGQTLKIALKALA